MSVVVDIYNAARDRWTTSKLSQARQSLAATTVGSLAIFAGGFTNGLVPSKVVDIYDASTNRWSTAELSQARGELAATTVGNLAIFAGGDTEYGTAQTDVVDVYDARTGQWSTMKLALRRGHLAAATVGTKAMFGGGDYLIGNFGGPSDVVEIYDAVTGHWSTQHLSQPHERLSATTVGTHAIFAGGGTPLSTVTDAVDVYDDVTGLWSTATLSVPRTDLAAAAVGRHAIFAGGQPVSFGGLDTVDIFTDASPAPSLDGNIDGATNQAAAITIRNSGDDALSPFTVAVYGAKANRKAMLLGTLTARNSLRAGASRELSVPLSIPAGASASDYHLVAEAVSDGSPTAFAAQVDIPPPTAQTIPGANLRKSLKVHTFTVSYHDAQRIDTTMLDGDDIVVTGPNAFEGHAQLLSLSRGKHPTTWVATYTVQGPGRRWDVSDNGTYTIHLQAGQVSDILGNGAPADHIGTFTVAIPAPSVPGTPTTSAQRSLTAFQSKRKINDLPET